MHRRLPIHPSLPICSVSSFSARENHFQLIFIANTRAPDNSIGSGGNRINFEIHGMKEIKFYYGRESK